MRLFSGVLASIIASLLLGFFPSVAEAEQNPCDPDSESYDARVCFEHVRALEASEKSAKRDLVLARRETTVAKSQLKAVTAEHTLTSNDLRIDIASRAKTIQHLETTVDILSEEKETAWGYVNTVSRTLALVIGLVFIGSIAALAVRARPAFARARHAIEVRDEKIRELEGNLRKETDARIMVQGDAAALRLELFQKSPNLLEIRKQINDLSSRFRSEMPKLGEVSAVLERALLLLRNNGSQLEKLSDPASSHTTV